MSKFASKVDIGQPSGDAQISVWANEPLAEFVEYITYGFTNPMPTIDSGPFMITARDIHDGLIDYSTARHTSLDAYRTRLTNKSRPIPGDVLLTKDGSIGRVAVCDRDDVCINQSVAVMRPNGRIRSKFLSYLLQAPKYQEQMRADADGSTIKHIYITRVDKMSVSVPPLSEQDAIVDTLSALDQKVAANVRLTDAAADLAAKLFHSITEDDPDERPLTELARFVNGRAYTKEASGTGRVVIRIAELNSGIGESTVRNNIEVPDDNVARPGDLLFAWSGSLTVHRWFHPEGIVNQHIFKVIPTGNSPVWLVHQLLVRKLHEFRAIAADKATTMGHIQRRHLDESVNVPGPQAIERVDSIMDSLWKTALSAEQESLDLATLRDTLLPHLMSGRLRVKDAEKQVEAVV